MIMMKAILFVALFPSVSGFMAKPTGSSFVRLSMSDVQVTEDPCYPFSDPLQAKFFYKDLYDDDCHMSSVYSATFVAGKWIKSMPCAKGIDEDCDMGELDVPEVRPDSGVDNVDVMDFLGLKKAESLKKKDDEASA